MNYEKDDSPFWQQAVKVAAFVLLNIVLIYFGFFHKGAGFTIDPIYGTKVYSTDFYHKLNPLHWWDVIGIVLFEGSLIAITGIWSLVLGSKYVKKPDGYAWVSWVVGAIGIILMMIQSDTLT